ncbi:MAG TPA: hypothetical protein VG498_20245, partial [Terriglobales bacterium]|nr:hypothetical protein [Terriglobales bacterium]
FRAADGFSPIKRAEYSIDAGEWHYVEPVGQISDSATEEYDFSAALPQSEVVAGENGSRRPAKRTRTRDGGAEAGLPEADQAPFVPGEHVVVVRVWDRFDNMSAAKTVTK